jgi:hypothetical protein
MCIYIITCFFRDANAERLEIRNRQCIRMERNPSKDSAMPEGSYPSFWNEFLILQEQFNIIDVFVLRLGPVSARTGPVKVVQ